MMISFLVIACFFVIGWAIMFYSIVYRWCVESILVLFAVPHQPLTPDQGVTAVALPRLLHHRVFHSHIVSVED
jgi:hypothetical protein